MKAHALDNNSKDTKAVNLVVRLMIWQSPALSFGYGYLFDSLFDEASSLPTRHVRGAITFMRPNDSGQTGRQMDRQIKRPLGFLRDR